MLELPEPAKWPRLECTEPLQISAALLHFRPSVASSTCAGECLPRCGSNISIHDYINYPLEISTNFKRLCLLANKAQNLILLRAIQIFFFYNCVHVCVQACWWQLNEEKSEKQKEVEIVETKLKRIIQEMKTPIMLIQCILLSGA